MRKGYRKIDECEQDIYDIIEDYSLDESIWCEDDDKTHRIKQIIANKLNDIEKRVLYTYADCGNLRAAAKKFNVSAPTFRSYLNQIREKIINEYNS